MLPALALLAATARVPGGTVARAAAHSVVTAPRASPPRASAVTGPLSGPLPDDFSLPGGRSVILFDGVCNFCNRWVGFVLDNDPDGIFCFASLQAATRALACCPAHHATLSHVPESAPLPRSLYAVPAPREFRSPSAGASFSRCAAVTPATSRPL
jgi:hypothetical protein